MLPAPLVNFEATENNYERMQRDSEFVSHVLSLAERQRLWKHKKDMCRRFRNVVTNPMVGLLATVVFEAIHYVRRAHGYNLLDALKGIQRLGDLSKLGSIVESHACQEPLLEVADFHAYWVNRIKQLKRERRDDVCMDRWLRLYDFNGCNGLHALSAGRQNDPVELNTILHFDLGRAAIAAEDAAFVAAEVLTADEFYVRMRCTAGSGWMCWSLSCCGRSQARSCDRLKCREAALWPPPSQQRTAARLGL